MNDSVDRLVAAWEPIAALLRDRGLPVIDVQVG
jgi:hypothetical protein